MAVVCFEYKMTPNEYRQMRLGDQRALVRFVRDVVWPARKAGNEAQ